VTRIAQWWGREELGDLAWWRNHPRDNGQESAIAMKHLRASTARAAQELGDVACDGDDKLLEFTANAFASSAQVSADMIKSSVFVVACSGGKLPASVKLPTTP
jgi:hypothetical protein